MRYLIVSDIHEDFNSLNYFSTKFNADQKLKLVSLGDNIGYSKHYDNKIERNPNACIEILRKHNFIALKGNHDLFHLKQFPINSVYKYPTNWYDLSHDEKLNLKSNTWLFLYEYESFLSTENKDYLKSLDEYHIENETLFSHFMYPDLTGSLVINKRILKALFPTHFIFMKVNKCSISFIGHLHVKSPIIISDTGKEIYFKTDDIITLDKNKTYIVLCPATTYIESRSKGILYDEKAKTLQVINNH